MKINEIITLYLTEQIFCIYVNLEISLYLHARMFFFELINKYGIKFFKVFFVNLKHLVVNILISSWP